MNMKISKEKAIELMIVEFQKGTAKDLILSEFVEKCQKDKRTIERYYKVAEFRYSEAQKEIQAAIVSTTIAETIEAQKRGLKSKFDRVLDLQKQCEDLEFELQTNIMTTHTFVDGEICIGIRPLNSVEKASIHKAIKELRAEISKLEGDYPATKTENLHEFKPLPPVIEL